MAKILCATSGLTGIVNASFELLERLTNEGHNVLVTAPRDISDKYQKYQFNFQPLPEIDVNYQPEVLPFAGPLIKFKRLIYKWFHLKARQKEALNHIYPMQFLQLLEKEQPDLIILDIELHEYIITAYGKGYNVLLLSQWFSTWKRHGLPYILHETVPGKGFWGSDFGIELSWLNVKLSRFWMFFKKRINSGRTDRRSTLQLLALKEGFPKAYIKENYWPGPISYDILPVISMTLESLEFPHEKRKNLHYIGPMVYEKRKNDGMDSVLDRKLDTIFEKRQKLGKKLIFCSVSTLKKGDLQFIQKVIKSVEKEPEWLLIISLGGMIKDKMLTTLPNNVFAFTFVPQVRVLEQSDLSINHGGIHSINECIYCEVPMLIYSGKRSDQNGCAARIAYHKLGIMADKDVDSSFDIKGNIKTVLNDLSYIQRVAEKKLELLDYKAHRNAEMIIEKCLSNEYTSKK